MRDFRHVLQRLRPRQYIATPVQGERLRVLSYNVLASSLADPTLYPLMSPHYLGLGFQKRQINCRTPRMGRRCCLRTGGG
eukprot:EC719340.1.p2 GENE.EC719340.1~~EC719340.1.p2  ORF type:complete len:80 (+),score=3.52 EC719340.1:32-271(+)